MSSIRGYLAVLWLLAVAMPLAYGNVKIETLGKKHRATGDGFEVVTSNIDIIKATTVNGGKTTVLLSGIPARKFTQTTTWTGKNTKGEDASVNIKVTGAEAWSWTYKNDKVELHFLPARKP